jgi:alkylhydroperoxidase family enzyme
MGGTDGQFAAMAAGDYSGFEPAWQAALRWAAEMTPTRGDASDETFAALRAHWDDAQIVEITAVVALFNYFNRVAEALRVPVTR